MRKSNCCDEVVILDFETTGLSADYDRIIEVGAVIVKDQKVTARFSELMNPGRRIPYFITDLTGITNTMLMGKPKPEDVMPKLKDFLGNRVILAHNAAFDRKFLHSEMARAHLQASNHFLCTLLLSRRLIPEAANYKLGTLAEHLHIKIGRAHRALDDVEATAQLWDHLHETVRVSTGIHQLGSDVFEMISKRPKHSIPQFFRSIREKAQS